MAAATKKCSAKDREGRMEKARQFGSVFMPADRTTRQLQLCSTRRTLASGRIFGGCSD